MAEIVNLRLARKARDRNRAADQAAANRAKHGRTSAERKQQEMEQRRHDRTLAGAMREQKQDNLD